MTRRLSKAEMMQLLKEKESAAVVSMRLCFEGLAQVPGCDTVQMDRRERDAEGRETAYGTFDWKKEVMEAAERAGFFSNCVRIAGQLPDDMATPMEVDSDMMLAHAATRGGGPIGIG